ISEPLGGFSAVARGTGSLPARHTADPSPLGTTTAPVTADEPADSAAPSDFSNSTDFSGSNGTTPVPAALAAPDTSESSILDSLQDDSLSDGILSIGAMSDGMGPNGLPTEEPSDRPPMPPIPTPDELLENGTLGTPPAPPSPEEISSFSETVDDISGLVEDADDAKGGLLARYRKNDD
ncbi:MAG: hypothetical protein AAF531_04145, partial [Actinomycetota bacterium]